MMMEADGPGPTGLTRERAMAGRATRVAEMMMSTIVVIYESMTRRKVFSN